MRLRRNRVFHGLKRPAIRMSMNKYNLYNLANYQSPLRLGQTLFKQKWVAKSSTRKYHGDMLGENRWKHQFRPWTHAVVPMDYMRLAANDGSNHAAGRGMGRENAPQKEKADIRGTPHTSMVYAALERRLDTAVFRALFASSARQARQMCVHGFVKVNGKKMVHPNYQLNPGDLFQVDPDRVMYAMGAPKDAAQRSESRRFRRKAAAAQQSSIGETDSSEAVSSEGASAHMDAPPAAPLDSRATLQQLLDQASMIAARGEDASAKRKQALRSFTRLVRSTLSRVGSRASPNPVPRSATQELQQLMDQLNITIDDSAEKQKQKRPGSQAIGASSASAPASESADSTEPSSISSTSPPPTSTSQQPSPDAPAFPDHIDPETGRLRPAVPLAETQTVRTHEANQLRAALQEARDNPIDPSKPYATPWQPRPFMSAFAFIPRYLEVHPAICSAIYVRHPVARPGLAEVPSPFDGEILQLAHSWYLRRR